jgi:hypothetical protein
MELQKTFKSSYIKYLKNNIDIEKYKNDSFEYDSSYVKILAYRPHVEASSLLESMLVSENDFEAAKLLFEAYKDIPRGQRLMPQDVITRPAKNGILFEKEKFEQEGDDNNG